MDVGKVKDEVKKKSQKAAHRTRKKKKSQEEVKDIDYWVDRDRVRLVLWIMAME